MNNNYVPTTTPTNSDDIELINRDYNQNMFDENAAGALNNLPNQDKFGLDMPESSGLTPLIENEMNDYMSHPNQNQLVLNYNQANPNFTYPPMMPLSDPYVGNMPYSENRKIAPFPNQPRRRRENTAPKTRPAFVMKVWSMVNDPKNREYIRWNEDGETFQVYHREEFMKEIIPKYFKHNNFASFVRQLNMYGWHKVQDINSGTLKDDKDHEEIWQFKNPNFIQGREDLLDKIIRNKTIQEDDTSQTTNTLQLILNEIDKIKSNQIAVNEDLKRIRQDNKTIWHENYLRRERQKQQSQTLDQILKFLATVYGNKQQFLDEQQDNPYTTGEYANTSPLAKPRLMLMDQEFKSPEVSPKPPPTPKQSESSIEEIIRSYTPKDTNVNKMFQQMINDNNGHVADNTQANSRFRNNIQDTQSPRQFFPELNTPNYNNTNYNNDKIDGIEQSLNKQGQSIQQVQNWIQKLAQQNNPQDFSNLDNIDDFDVNEFLQQENSGLSDVNKRSIEEIYDEDHEVKKRKI